MGVERGNGRPFVVKRSILLRWIFVPRVRVDLGSIAKIELDHRKFSVRYNGAFALLPSLPPKKNERSSSLARLSL